MRAPDALSWREKLSYGFGNFGVNLSFGMTSAYLLYFYTDVYGVSAGTVASLFLFARFLDAAFDPLMGLAIDRTRTRWGKHRPWLLWLAIPFALTGVLVFWTPPLAGMAKIAFIFASYTLLGVLYSAVSLPLNSMLPTLTRDPRQRNTVNALRELLGSSATVGISYAALPLVRHFAKGDEAKGFLVLAIGLALVTVVAMLNAFANTRERVALTADEVEQLTTRQSLSATRGNWPWIATMLVNFFFWVGFTGHLQSFVFYASEVMGDGDLTSTLTLTMLAVLVGTGLAGICANAIGKRLTGGIGAALAALFTALIPMGDSLQWLLATNILAYFGQGLIGGLLFSLMADAVDYGAWRSGYRAQGFLFAASSFGVKLGMSVGGAAGAWFLGMAGYAAGMPATPAVVTAVKAGHAWLPAASYVAMGLSLLLFRFAPAYRPGAAAS
ncbi:MFS transporter [Novosphingobium profundi]|uniref:glycoside-pentoside-hexuronide (GPH):cation symporter n=1 Tax=Novosphingobium profundi TaxID=1774954 RepID=UPI001BDA3B40|nr:glycoside-pentoside-hexuronide (GPH):cation symporter [Novosphingobium profundi]MBT0671510.1 MFS transporter [Novosphingobium profundi]